MRTFIVLILLGVSILGANNGLRVVTTTKSNVKTACISTKDVFPRDGQNNVICTTRTKAAAVQIRIHRFYHGRKLIWIVTGTPDYSSTSFEAGSSYAVDFKHGTSNRLK